ASKRGWRSPRTQGGLSETARSAVPAAGLAQQQFESPDYVKHIKSSRTGAAVLYEVAQMFSKNLGVEGVVKETVAQLERAIPFTTSVVYLRAPDGCSVAAAYAYGRNAGQIQGKHLGMGQGIAGWVVINNRHMCNTDPMLDLDRFLRSNEDDYRTAAVFPLTVGDETMGALGVYSSELSAYDTGHIQLLESVSRLASTAIHHALLNEQARATTQIAMMSEPVIGRLPISAPSM